MLSFSKCNNWFEHTSNGKNVVPFIISRIISLLPRALPHKAEKNPKEICLKRCFVTVLQTQACLSVVQFSYLNFRICKAGVSVDSLLNWSYSSWDYLLPPPPARSAPRGFFCERHRVLHTAELLVKHCPGAASPFEPGGVSPLHGWVVFVCFSF